MLQPAMCSCVQLHMCTLRSVHACVWVYGVLVCKQHNAYRLTMALSPYRCSMMLEHSMRSVNNGRRQLVLTLKARTGK